MPAPVFSFLEKFDFTGKEIWPFCTYDDGGFGHSLEDLRKTCPTARIREGLSMRGAEVQNEIRAIEEWACGCFFDGTNGILRKNYCNIYY